jgi:hypothetical protein
MASLLASVLKEYIEKTAYAPPTQTEPSSTGAPPGQPPMDPAALMSMLGGAMGGGQGAPPGQPPMPPQGPPPTDPNAQPPADPAAMMAALGPPPVDPNAPPQDPNAGGPVPVVLSMDDLKAILAEAVGNKGEGSGKGDVEELKNRVGALEEMLAQVLQAFGLMPPQEGSTGAPQEVAPSAGPINTEKTAEEKRDLNKAMYEAKLERESKPLLASLKKIRKV